MADIINLNNVLDKLDSSNKMDVLNEVINQASAIKDICIFIKDKNDDHVMFYTAGLSMSDKSLFIQMLQHDIFQEFAPAEDISFEQDS